jgi:hypothetical protein
MASPILRKPMMRRKGVGYLFGESPLFWNLAPDHVIRGL